MLIIPDKLKHYANTQVVNPSKNSTLVSDTPLSSNKNLIFLNKKVVARAVTSDKIKDPAIKQMKLSKTLNGVYQ